MNRLILLCTLILAGCSSLEFAKFPQSQSPPLPYYDNINVAFVLGSGGIKGLAHVGVMEELMAAGIKPDLIVGSSAGAIVGALYATSLDIHRTRQILLETQPTDMLDIALYHLPFGLSSSDGLQDFLTTHLGTKTYKDLKIPFASVATNLETGALTAFGSGPVAPTVLASAAYPGVFSPVRIYGHYFVDGAVSRPVPVEVARCMGAKFVIAIELTGTLTETPPTQVLGVVKRCLEINYIHHTDLSAHGADFIIRVPFKDVGTFDDDKNEQIYTYGRKIGKDVVKALRDKLNAFAQGSTKHRRKIKPPKAATASGAAASTLTAAPDARPLHAPVPAPQSPDSTTLN